MGTRGAYGFRYMQEDKISYNNFDSYPEALGLEVLNFVKNTPLEEMKEIAERLIPVDEREIPTDEEQDELLSQGIIDEKGYIDWYWALREVQGNMAIFKKGLRYILDSKNFLRDSLFCEYAYVINLDEEIVEFYVGFQEKPQNNRYLVSKPDDQGYYNCRLALKLPIEIIKDKSFIPEEQAEALDFNLRGAFDV